MPRKFWLGLLLEALPLLNASTAEIVFFSPAQSAELLRCLNTLCLPHNLATAGLEPFPHREVEAIRRALGFHLSKGLLSGFN